MKNRTEYKNQWKKEHTDQKNLTLPKGRLAEVQKAAESVGEKVNEFIVKSIDERIEKISMNQEETTGKIPDVKK